MPLSKRPIRVLVVDDSQVFRRFLTRALVVDPMIEVIGEASCAESAKNILRNKTPDVITLDLEMPGEDGLDFLRNTIVGMKIPTIVISGKTQRGTRMSIEALEAGALDVFPKPRGLAPGQAAHEALAEVGARLRALARARVDYHRPQVEQPITAWTEMPAKDWVIAIGASTGGVQALGTVLHQMPANCPPIVIVQHMPEAFTEAFARRLNQTCTIEIREARQNDRLRPGLALIAPGGERHMVLQRADRHQLEVALVPGDPVSFSRPAIDELFRSVATTAAPRVSAAVLTGMGSDGARGLLALRQAGAQTFAQDQASSVIYGMPAQAWEIGAAMEQVSLDQMTTRLLASVGTSSANTPLTGATASPKV
jgi:two-component system chemotaxis response regulator CheB